MEQKGEGERARQSLPRQSLSVRLDDRNFYHPLRGHRPSPESEVRISLAHRGPGKLHSPTREAKGTESLS